MTFYDLSNDDVLYNKHYNTHYNIKEETFINDLNIYDVFQAINFCKTVIGKQYFYHTLCTPKLNEIDINELELKINYFDTNEGLKKLFDNASHRIVDGNMSLLPGLIFGRPFLTPQYFKWVWLLLSIELVVGILSFFYLPIILMLLPLLLVNTVIHFINKDRLFLFRRTYRPVSNLLEFAKEMKAGDNKRAFNNQSVDDAIKSLSPLKSKLILLSMADCFTQNDLFIILFVLIELIKTVTLFEVLLTRSLMSSINDKKNEIRVLYEMAGKIDLVYSICVLRYKTQEWCHPEFINLEKSISLLNISHPLISKSVPNSIELTDKSAIIAGSNMSGKTTFLRTVGINNVLAQTINTCFAREFKLPFLKTVTSLNSVDNILEGESFYFAEAKNLLQLLNADSKINHLIIVDELFKGTNSIERTAISKATLSYLNKYCGIVFTSTHDLELVKLLSDDFDSFHFKEDFNNNEIIFDYKIKKGNLYVFNAIKTLAKMGFPELLIKEVEKAFVNLEKKHLKYDYN